MTSALTITIGQHSERGHKEVNQDFHGALIPDGSALTLKGIAIAIADGISTSSVSRVAAESAIKSFLTDYYCTSDTWSVKTAAQRVISAANSWLYAQTRRSLDASDMDRGYVCTFTAMVLKARLAHIFHVGDCRVSRLAGPALEPLTEDHRIVVSSQQSYLARALGAKSHVEIDYRTVPLQVGDIFILSSDGVHEHVNGTTVAAAIEIHAENLDHAARQIVEEALRAGSRDNLTVQIVRIDAVPGADVGEFTDDAVSLTPPPLPELGGLLDGYKILRELHFSSRSHVYLALDTQTDIPVAIKVPSIDLRSDVAYRKRFMMEEWIARRLSSPHVLKAHLQSHKRSYLYTVTEYVDGSDTRPVDDRPPESGFGDRPQYRRADRQGPACIPSPRDAASGPAATEHHDRPIRHGEAHRFWVGARCWCYRDRSGDGGRRYPWHGTVHCPGILCGRERHPAL